MYATAKRTHSFAGAFVLRGRQANQRGALQILRAHGVSSWTGVPAPKFHAQIRYPPRPGATLRAWHAREAKAIEAGVTAWTVDAFS